MSLLPATPSSLLHEPEQQPTHLDLAPPAAAASPSTRQLELSLLQLSLDCTPSAGAPSSAASSPAFAREHAVDSMSFPAGHAHPHLSLSIESDPATLQADPLPAALPPSSPTPPALDTAAAAAAKDSCATCTSCSCGKWPTLLGAAEPLPPALVLGVGRRASKPGHHPPSTDGGGGGGGPPVRATPRPRPADVPLLDLEDAHLPLLSRLAKRASQAAQAPLAAAAAAAAAATVAA